MKRLQHFLALLLTLTSFLWLCAATSAQVPRNHRIVLNFNQYPDAPSGLSYSLRVNHQLSFLPASTPREIKLIAPDGTVFDQVEEETLPGTFAQVSALAFGKWTAMQKYEDVDITYQFDVESFDLTEVFTDTPYITSPPPGSNVPTEFTVNWQYVNGSQPDRRGAGIFASNNVGPFSFEPGGPCCSLKIGAPLQSPGTGSLELRVNTATTLPMPELDGISPLPADVFSFSSSFRSWSAQASYTVVPEPNTAVLSLGGMALLLHCRRRKGS